MALTRDQLFWDSFTRHAQCTVEAAKLLVEMLEHPERAQANAGRINRLENDGDTITHDTVTALHQTWITPLDREEIHGLITRLDDVLDFVDAAGDRIALYELGEKKDDAILLAQLLLRCAEDIAKAVGMLSDMKNVKPLLELCIAINKHEHDADQVFRSGLARLFKSEATHPVEIMKWRDVLDAIETATDRAEDVANIIEGIVLEHA
jgi:predicted phosphate transport protein (TIGR00153 family)